MSRFLLACVPALALLMQGSHGIHRKLFGLSDIDLQPSMTPDHEHIALSTETLDVSDPSVILRALATSYPDRIHLVKLRDGDWSVQVNDTTYYWAEGRLLPRELRHKHDDFSPYRFYPYPAELPPLRALSAEERERLNDAIDRREAKKIIRYPGFLNSLWGMENFKEAEETVIRIDMLGHNVRIHPELQKPLAQVEADILRAAETDIAVSNWLEELEEVSAYVWRKIAGSSNRSLHSYGIAIDLEPSDYKGKQIYWRWTRDFYDDWWAVRYEERYMIPRSVVQIFEDHGFIWGGKWFLFDQIHFEYRPELIVLNNWRNANYKPHR